MKNNASFLYAIFLILSDALALVTAFVGAYILRVSLGHAPIANPVTARSYLLAFLTILPLWLITFALFGLYNGSVYEKRFSEFGRLFIGTIVGTLGIVSYDYFSNDAIFPAKLVPVYGFILTFVLLVVFRNIVRIIRRALFSYNFGISNVLIVGNTVNTTELVNWLANPKVSGYRVVGVVGSHERLPGTKHYPTFAAALKAIKVENIHSIMQTELFPNTADNDEILAFAQNNHVAYRFIPGNSELFVGNIDVELFQSSIPMIAVHQTALIGWGKIAKRLFDLVFGTFFLILSLPIMGIICLIMIVFDHGDPVFKQTRLGRFNRKIKVYKFRTYLHAYNRMTPEEGFAKLGKPELAIKYRKNGDYLKNDPRVSRLGRFLRRTSLDELPQLINVVKGDLSLVGPRPLEPFEMEQYIHTNTVLSVKTGLTGLAVISGRRDIPFEERRKLDLYYVQNWSFWLDIIILFKTLKIVLSRRGAE